MNRHIQQNLNDLLMNEDGYADFGDPEKIDPEVVGDEIIYDLLEEEEPENFNFDDIEIDSEGLSLI